MQWPCSNRTKAFTRAIELIIRRIPRCRRKNQVIVTNCVDLERCVLLFSNAHSHRMWIFSSFQALNHFHWICVCVCCSVFASPFTCFACSWVWCVNMWSNAWAFWRRASHKTCTADCGRWKANSKKTTKNWHKSQYECVQVQIEL